MLSLLVMVSVLLRWILIPVCREWLDQPVQDREWTEAETKGIKVESMDWATKLLYGIPVDVNRATAEDLTLLEGIGPVLAGRVVEHREREGPFESAEELLDVDGIGPKTLQKIRESIAVSQSGSSFPREGGTPEPSD